MTRKAHMGTHPGVSKEKSLLFIYCKDLGPGVWTEVLRILVLTHTFNNHMNQLFVIYPPSQP